MSIRGKEGVTRLATGATICRDTKGAITCTLYQYDNVPRSDDPATVLCGDTEDTRRVSIPASFVSHAIFCVPLRNTAEVGSLHSRRVLGKLTLQGPAMEPQFLCGQRYVPVAVRQDPLNMLPLHSRKAGHICHNR